MNERIKELATQAKLRSPLLLQHWGKIDALTDSEQEELENIEKFAELIVRECAITVIDGCEMRNAEDVKRAEYHAKRIKQHFGVES